MLKQSPKQTAIARKLRLAGTWAERLLWSWLRGHRFTDYKFRRQQTMGPHILDFYCAEAKLNIELDGSQHGHPEHQQADAARDAWLNERGIRVLRFWNGRLRREEEVVRAAIWQALQERAPKPMPAYCRPGVVGSSRQNKPVAEEQL